MLDRWFGHNTQLYLHLLGLTGVAVGMPLSKVVLSISTLFLALIIILKGDYIQTWNNIKKNKFFLLILGFLAIHIIALLWTDDYQYALHDLKVKLPLLVIPLVMAGTPIKDQKVVDYLLLVFLATVMGTSIINYCCYQQWFGFRFYDDIRGMSLFVSHVRYSLLVVMALAVSLYFLLEKKNKLVFIIPVVWLLYYTFYSQIISGISSVVVVFLVITAYLFWSRRKVIMSILIGGSIVGMSVLLFWLLEPVNIDKSDYVNLDKFTSEGHMYIHDFNFISPETNKPIGLYSCDPELKREWNNRSKVDYFGWDIKGQPIQQTLKRYLASKDLRKDAKGISTLTDEEIKLIEQGCASKYCHGMYARIIGLRYQILNEDDPNGHSFLQRLEYWKAGTNIAKANIIFGVGTGDVQQQFNDYYAKTDSPLKEENWNRAHNMFITVLLSFGVLGILYFVWIHFDFIRHHIRNKNLIALLFISIIMTSYLMEDTLETQVGVTFFAFFYGLFSAYPNRQSIGD